MRKRLLTIFEKARDNFFLLLTWLIIFSFLLTVGVIIAIKAPSLIKFAGLGLIVGSFYFLSYYPTFRDRN